MNTLSKEITGKILGSPEKYEALTRAWKQACKDGVKLEVEHYILYAALRGKDWRKAITPLRDKKRLENGAFENCGLVRGLVKVHFTKDVYHLLAPFAGSITAETVKSLLTYIPTSIDARQHYNSLREGKYNFDAYNVPISLSEQARAIAAEMQK